MEIKMKIPNTSILIFWAFSYLLFNACQDDDYRCKTSHNFMNPTWENCLVEERVVEIDPSIVCLLGSSTEEFCDTINYEMTIPISEEVKAWLPYYCLETNDSISFKSSSGCFAYGSMEFKSFNETKTYTKLDSCSQTDKKLLICDKIEIVEILINLGSIGNGLSINVRGPGNHVNYEYNKYSSLSLLGRSPNYTHFGTAHINAEGEFQEIEVSKDLFHDSITLGGVHFENVIEFIRYDSESESNNFFYSKDYGIVSFTDNNGEQWIYLK